MGDEPVVTKVVSRINATNTQEDFAFVVKSETASATIITGSCNDGMSEDIYTHHIIYTSDDNVMYGCCNIISK
jgi:uncharacterized membrane protein